MYTQTQGLLSTCGADCFHSSDGARAIDVGDKDKVCLSRGDRQCHMGKACSQAPPLECNWRGISPVAFLLLSPHCDRHVYCILKEHIAQSRTHPGPVITPSSTVSTAQHEARVGQHGFIASFGCILNLLTSPNLVQTLSQHVDATSNVSHLISDQACRAQRCSERQCSHSLGYLSSSHSLVCQLVYAQRPREEVRI
jgi:hypothetical protein